MPFQNGSSPPPPRPLAQRAPGEKIKVAVLGGGCASMAAVWGLLQSEQAHRYDITVYQLGWRLGGKGASGRNREKADRIEEHGLHIWGGMYENAFSIMRQVYGELNRPEHMPLSAWFDPERPHRSAFLPHNFLTLAEYRDEQWDLWNAELPANGSLPGDGSLLPTLQDWLEELLEGVLELVAGPNVLAWLERLFIPDGDNPLLDKLLRAVGEVSPPAVRDTVGEFIRARLHSRAHEHVRRAQAAIRQLPEHPAEHTGTHYESILSPVRELVRWFERTFGHLLEHDTALRRIFITLNLAQAVIRGVLEDEIYQRGFDCVDNEDFTQWLARHGATRATCESYLVRGWYDFFFAYVHGDPARPSLSAASALRTVYRYLFTYKGAFFWKMQAGMGDTVFAPLYEVLRLRGVNFRFFHKVEELTLQRDGHPTRQIQRIRMSRQVDLAPGRREYEPLYVVKDLPCWPSAPLWEQLEPEQARKLQEQEINLESAWSPWQSVETFELELGRDFDLVILGISVGALRSLTPELARHSQPWQQMLENMATNQTLGLQLWLKEPQRALGWKERSTVGTVDADPFNTWANMDPLLERESWEKHPDPPRSLVYLCGTLMDEPRIPSGEDSSFPALEHRRVKGISEAWLSSNIAPLWPRATRPGTNELNWSLLVTVQGNPPGQWRLCEQFWKANIDPSERYVLSLPGTARYRLRADQSGFENLFLAGDWLATGINAGCVEAAVMGGLQASQAISGFPKKIVGDEGQLFASAKDGPRRRPGWVSRTSGRVSVSRT